MTAAAADLPALERLRLHRMVSGDQVEFILNAAAVDALLAEVSAERAARIEAERALKNAAFQFGKHAQAIADVASRRDRLTDWLFFLLGTAFGAILHLAAGGIA